MKPQLGRPQCGSALRFTAGRNSRRPGRWYFDRQAATRALVLDKSAAVSKMEKLQLGNSDLLVSAACIGTMVRFGILPLEEELFK